MRWAGRVGLGTLVTALVLTGERAATQSASAPGLKAAYLFNFAQFVEWPADALPAGAPLALCVFGDGAVADALEKTTVGRSVGGHGLTVVRLRSGVPLPTCHVLYLAGSDRQGWRDVIGTLNGKLVLTVSDAARFVHTGGMVELLTNDGRMQIAVNTDALHRSQVRLSSRVLTLATIVRDAPP
jgi:hypothetical protein